MYALHMKHIYYTLNTQGRIAASSHQILCHSVLTLQLFDLCSSYYCRVNSVKDSGDSNCLVWYSFLLAPFKHPWFFLSNAFTSRTTFLVILPLSTTHTHRLLTGAGLSHASSITRWHSMIAQKMLHSLCLQKVYPDCLTVIFKECFR